jgi:hypothetical protein
LDAENPAEYEMMVPKKSPSEKSAHLDPNHTHFILVDTAKENEFGGEVRFRAELEEAIHSGQKLDLDTNLNSSMKKTKKQEIPIVTLVLGGGRNTVRQVLKAVEKNIPCIIFDVSFYKINFNHI